MGVGGGQGEGEGGGAPEGGAGAGGAEGGGAGGEEDTAEETYCVQCNRNFKTHRALLVHYASSNAHLPPDVLDGSASQQQAFCERCKRWFKNVQGLQVRAPPLTYADVC